MLHHIKNQVWQVHVGLMGLVMNLNDNSRPDLLDPILFVFSKVYYSL